MARTDPAVSRRFTGNLIRCRRRLRLSQEEVGFVAGLHRTEISMLERGIRLPRIDTLIKHSRALEVRPEQLLEGIEWVPDMRLRRGSFSSAPVSGSRPHVTDSTDG